MSRRPIAWALAAAVVLLALVPIGRWERERRAEEQNRGMARVLADIGPLDSPSLDAFRVLTTFDCLLYKRAGNPFALEVCVDHEGRVLETIDRRGDEPEISSLRDDVENTAHRVDRAEIERLLDRMIAEPDQ